MDGNLKFAVLIDGDNAQPSLLEAVLKEIKTGNNDSNRPGAEIAIKRIYGDWTTNNMNGWKNNLHSLGVRPVQQFRYDNNATDGALMMDAIDIIHLNPRINAFCIVSSDSDFYNLALRIRENGHYVLGIGTKQTKEVFRKACNDFVYTNNLSPTTKQYEETVQPKSSKSKAVDSVESFIKNVILSITSNEIEWVALGILGSALKSEDPGFDPRSFGHKNLISLIKSYDLFETKSDDATPPNYSVKLCETVKVEDKKLEGTIKKFISHFGFIEHESGDYYFHVSNIEKESRETKLRKGIKVVFNVFQEPNPTADDTDEKNGKASNITVIG
jgi:cold shock CspA family protein/uncharacterized LabA/DUF88 family protein